MERKLYFYNIQNNYLRGRKKEVRRAFFPEFSGPRNTVRSIPPQGRENRDTRASFSFREKGKTWGASGVRNSRTRVTRGGRRTFTARYSRTHQNRENRRSSPPGNALPDEFPCLPLRTGPAASSRHSLQNSRERVCSASFRFSIYWRNTLPSRGMVPFTNFLHSPFAILLYFHRRERNRMRAKGKSSVHPRRQALFRKSRFGCGLWGGKNICPGARGGNNPASCSPVGQRANRARRRGKKDRSAEYQ